MTIADHFEPLWNGASDEAARARVDNWHQSWPPIAVRHADSNGRPPQYCFFYPAEEYRPTLLEPLSELTRAGIADVEVHLHHDRDTPDGFRERLTRFLDALHHRHGLLRRSDGRLRFGFIHGNWALDNSRPDGRWCGLNEEISLLAELGCYADLTLPAAPDPSQAGPVNVIYRVKDDPLQPRSHALGVPVVPGLPPVGDLTMIPGPLGLDWHGRPLWKPRLETGELASYHVASDARIQLWLRIAPRIGDTVFLKLFTHGAVEQNSRHLLGGGLDRLLACLEDRCRQLGVSLRYATAWEMWQAIEDLREGGTVATLWPEPRPRTSTAPASPDADVTLHSAGKARVSIRS